MEEAVRARAAAREAIRDIEPARLRDDIDELLSEASMTPGALALVSGRAVDETIDSSAIEERAAGVQLIYDGLRLTRQLARAEPWRDLDDHTRPNLEILAADILVSRGFYLLARTEAAGRAVETVRAFGGDQTRRRDPDADADALDRTLEENVFELAAIAGASAGTGGYSSSLLEYSRDLARSIDERPIPDAGAVLPGVENDIVQLSARQTSAGEDGQSVRPITDGNRND